MTQAHTAPAPSSATRFDTVERPDPYDVIPYEARPLAITHPMRLATAALRRGFRCEPPDRCRMLDLGCADATNLLPLALSYPNSEFVGVERSAKQIASARADVASLGLQNLTLIHADVTDLGDRLGRFDYIVAHGLYSWVSDEARAQILRLISACLSRRGVGYLSYNAQPGWGARGAVREILRAHTREMTDLHEKLAHARAHIGTLLRVIGDGEQEPFARHVAQILEPLAARSDSYLMHEYLSEHNRAFAFSEISASLGTHGLSVLADLLRATSTLTAHEGLAAAFDRAALPPAEVEAAVDLVTCRQFRASLICREVDRVTSPPSRDLEGWLPGCEVALAGGPSSEPPMLETASPSGATTRPRAPTRTGIGITPESITWLRAAFAALADVWPGSIGVEALFEQTGIEPEARAAALRDLLRICEFGHLELRSHTLPVVATAGPRPVVSPLTRLDARRGRSVTNQLHRPVTLSPEIAGVAALLDGTRDVPALARERQGATNPPLGLEQVARRITAALKQLEGGALLLA